MVYLKNYTPGVLQVLSGREYYTSKYIILVVAVNYPELP